MAEHCAYALKFLIQLAVDDVASDVQDKIDYEELRSMVRDFLKLSRSQLSDHKLDSLWRTLDDDGSQVAEAGVASCAMVVTLAGIVSKSLRLKLGAGGVLLGRG